MTTRERAQSAIGVTKSKEGGVGGLIENEALQCKMLRGLIKNEALHHKMHGGLIKKEALQHKMLGEWIKNEALQLEMIGGLMKNEAQQRSGKYSEGGSKPKLCSANCSEG